MDSMRLGGETSRPPNAPPSRFLHLCPHSLLAWTLPWEGLPGSLMTSIHMSEALFFHVFAGLCIPCRMLTTQPFIDSRLWRGRDRSQLGGVSLPLVLTGGNGQANSLGKLLVWHFR